MMFKNYDCNYIHVPYNKVIHKTFLFDISLTLFDITKMKGFISYVTEFNLTSVQFI